MAETEIKFVQIAASPRTLSPPGDNLYGLREEGDVWVYDWNKKLWTRLSMAFEQVAGGPLGGKLG